MYLGRGSQRKRRSRGTELPLSLPLSYEFSGSQRQTATYLLGEVNLSFSYRAWPKPYFFLEFNQDGSHMILRYFRGPARVALAGLLIVTIALVDSRVDAPISFGFLYLFPILLVGTVWPRWAILLAAIICTVLSDAFDPFPFGWAMSLPQGILVFTSLGGTGLFAYEVNRRSERELENLRRVEREAMARREAEEQLEFLIGSSPVAILTMTED